MNVGQEHEPADYFRGLQQTEFLRRLQCVHHVVAGIRERDNLGAEFCAERM